MLYMCSQVFRFICNSHKMEVEQMSFESEWINKLSYIYMMEYISTIKRNELLIKQKHEETQNICAE